MRSGPMGFNSLPERIRAELVGSLVVTKKDARIYYLKPPVLIYGIIFPFVLLLTFALGRDISPISLVPGMVGITLFFTASSVGPIIAPWETRMKTLERLIACPISIRSILLGDILAGFMFGTMISLVPLFIGTLGFGAGVDSPHTLTATILLSAFCFSSLGILLSAPPTDNPSNVMMLSTLVRLPLVFISGIFIPIDQLPAGGRIAAMFSPLTYSTDLLKYSLQGDHYYPIALDLSMLLAFTILFLILGMEIHKRSLSKRL